MEINCNPYDYFWAALQKEIVDHWKGDQKTFADKIGITVPYLSELFHKKKMASPEVQGKICNAVQIKFETFIKIGRALIETGKIPLISESFESPLIVNVISQEDKDLLNDLRTEYHGIPLYESGRLSAGINGIEFDPYETPASMVVIYRPELQGCKNHVLKALRVGGDSMEPTIAQGSIVVVELSDKKEANNKIFVVNVPEGGVDVAAVKRIKRWKEGFALISDKPGISVELSDLDWNRLCVGRVVWMWRDIRNI